MYQWRVGTCVTQPRGGAATGYLAASVVFGTTLLLVYGAKGPKALRCFFSRTLMLFASSGVRFALVFYFYTFIFFFNIVDRSAGVDRVVRSPRDHSI